MSENGKWELREGKFTLNKSTLKHEDGKDHPNWFGETLIKGVKYKIAGWATKSQAGNVYINGTIQEKVPMESPTSVDLKDEDLF